MGRNSPVVEALLEAIEEGKQVAVLVELKARFDEESNIEWASALEARRRARGLRPAGAEDPLQGRAGRARARATASAATCTSPPATTTSSTAHLYTDLGMFTCDDDIGADATDLFNYLTGYSAKADYQQAAGGAGEPARALSRR